MQRLKDPAGKIYFPTKSKLSGYAKVVAFALAVFIALSCFFYLNSHFSKIISGTSMCPTLNSNFIGEKDLVLVDKFEERKYEDIVIINVKGLEYFDNRGTKLLVKRIIALGGDKIKLIHNDETGQNEVWLKNKQNPDGIKLEEDYIVADTDSYVINIFNTQSGWIKKCEVDNDGYTIIPDDYVFCMGDNRNASLDCRYTGPLELSRVMGVVDKIIYDGTLLHDILATLFQFDLNF